MVLSLRRCWRAVSSDLDMLGLTGLVLCRTWLILIRMSSAVVLFSLRSTGSVAWIISDVGTVRGVAKFMPRERTPVSLGERLRRLRLTTVCCRNICELQRCVGVCGGRVGRWDIGDPSGLSMQRGDRDKEDLIFRTDCMANLRICLLRVVVKACLLEAAVRVWILV